MAGESREWVLEIADASGRAGLSGVANAVPLRCRDITYNILQIASA